MVIPKRSPAKPPSAVPVAASSGSLTLPVSMADESAIQEDAAERAQEVGILSRAATAAAAAMAAAVTAVTAEKPESVSDAGAVDGEGEAEGEAEGGAEGEAEGAMEGEAPSTPPRPSPNSGSREASETANEPSVVSEGWWRPWSSRKWRFGYGRDDRRPEPGEGLQGPSGPGSPQSQGPGSPQAPGSPPR